MLLGGGEFPPQEPGTGATLSFGSSVIVDIKQPALLRAQAEVDPSLTPGTLRAAAAHEIGRTPALSSNLRLSVAMPCGQHLGHLMHNALPAEGPRRGRLLFERKATRQRYIDLAANEFHGVNFRSRATPACYAFFDRLPVGKAAVERNQIEDCNDHQ